MPTTRDQPERRRLPASQPSSDKAAARRIRQRGPRLHLGGNAEPITLQVKADWRQSVAAIAAIVSVLLVAAGLFYTNAANRAENEANREQLDLSRRGQITDRFAKAVEQLGQSGSDKIGVRLGAIYSLERISLDSPPEQPNIMEVLAAYVRVYSPFLGEPRAEPMRPEDYPKATPVDIHAALLVLGRRDAQRDGVDGLDLRRVDLVGMDLNGSNLSNAFLVGSDLSYAWFDNADFAGVIITPHGGQ